MFHFSVLCSIFRVQPEEPVLMTMRIHLFPSRTQKLSSWVPKILGWRRPGKIERCRYQTQETRLSGFLSYCSLAQSVEHAAVNRGVVSSSLTGAAKGKKPVKDRLLSFACCGTLQLAIPCFGRRTAVNLYEHETLERLLPLLFWIFK